jgi:hypothetical protein
MNRCPLCRDRWPSFNTERKPTKGTDGVLYCSLICALAATGKLPEVRNEKARLE